MRNSRNQNVSKLLRHLGEAWTPEVLKALGPRSSRFNELKHELGIPGNTLSRVLRHLERDGFVARFEAPVLQRQVAYELTSAGQSFREIVATCRDWAQAQEDAVLASRHAFDHNGGVNGGQPETMPEECLDGAVPRGGTIAYAAVVVRDLSRAARAWADVFNVPVPDILDVSAVVPEGGETAVRSAWVPFRNLRINLIQPVDAIGPFADYMARRGQGFHHIGFYVADDLRARVHRLEASGGRPILGSPDTQYGELDFRDRLGTAVEVNRSGTCCHSFPELPEYASLGSTHAVSNLTVAVGNIDDARRHYLSALGMSMSPLRTIHCLQHTSAGTQRGRAVAGTIRQSALALNVVQPSGGGLFDQRVQRLGNAFHHLGFRVREPLGALVTRLEKKGGRLVAGDPDAGYVQVDFVETLGVVVELTRSARPA